MNVTDYSVALHNPVTQDCHGVVWAYLLTSATPATIIQGKTITTHLSNSRLLGLPQSRLPRQDKRLTGRQDLGSKPGQDRGPDPTSPGKESHRLISAAAATTSAHAYEARNYITTKTTASTAPGEGGQDSGSKAPGARSHTHTEAQSNLPDP